jgi:DHA2 family metal-tetracycline-proton antiporter-like MFS transporter
VGLGLYNLLNFAGMAFGPAASKIIESTNSYSLNFILISLLLGVHFLLLFKLSAIQSKVVHA